MGYRDREGGDRGPDRVGERLGIWKLKQCKEHVWAWSKNRKIGFTSFHCWSAICDCPSSKVSPARKCQDIRGSPFLFVCSFVWFSFFKRFHWRCALLASYVWLPRFLMASPVSSVITVHRPSKASLFWAKGKLSLRYKSRNEYHVYRKFSAVFFASVSVSPWKFSDWQVQQSTWNASEVFGSW